MKIIVYTLLSLVVALIYSAFWSAQEIIPGSVWLYFSVGPITLLGIYLINKNK